MVGRTPSQSIQRGSPCICLSEDSFTEVELLGQRENHPQSFHGFPWRSPLGLADGPQAMRVWRPGICWFPASLVLGGCTHLGAGP